MKLTRRRAGRTAGAQQPAQQEAACFQSLYMSNRLFSSIIQTFCRCKLALMLCAAAARPAIRHAAALQPLSRPPRLRSTQPSQLRPAATGDDLLVAHLLEQPPEHFVAVDAHGVEAGAAQLVGGGEPVAWGVGMGALRCGIKGGSRVGMGAGAESAPVASTSAEECCTTLQWSMPSSVPGKSKTKAMKGQVASCS